METELFISVKTALSHLIHVQVQYRLRNICYLN